MADHNTATLLVKTVDIYGDKHSIYSCSADVGAPSALNMQAKETWMFSRNSQTINFDKQIIGSESHRMPVQLEGNKIQGSTRLRCAWGHLLIPNQPIHKLHFNLL